ncbi:hypothetical protein DFH09DRAFT_1354519 [Mycena vulgaris]|nr:hypothetical protein DFH09DRAFT_1354519 [Mycena vulgaris]
MRCRRGMRRAMCHDSYSSSCRLLVNGAIHRTPVNQRSAPRCAERGTMRGRDKREKSPSRAMNARCVQGHPKEKTKADGAKEGLVCPHEYPSAPARTHTCPGQRSKTPHTLCRKPASPFRRSGLGIAALHPWEYSNDHRCIRAPRRITPHRRIHIRTMGKRAALAHSARIRRPSVHTRDAHSHGTPTHTIRNANCIGARHPSSPEQRAPPESIAPCAPPGIHTPRSRAVAPPRLCARNHSGPRPGIYNARASHAGALADAAQHPPRRERRLDAHSPSTSGRTTHAQPSHRMASPRARMPLRAYPHA